MNLFSLFSFEMKLSGLTVFRLYFLDLFKLTRLLHIQGDVIVSFDGITVGCEATVPFRSTERIAFRYLTSQK